tara:strand:- start:346 stop:579 length:234 start_codon:yes stop_codon:yes gene_type:complete
MSLAVRYTAMSWCLKRNIKIYIVPLRNGMKTLFINDSGAIIKSHKFYKTDKEASEKIWDLYTHIYLKYKDDKQKKEN